MKLRRLLACALIAAASSVAFAAPDQISIGFIAPQTGPGGNEGVAMVNAFKLGLEHLENKLGGIPVELVVGDDQAKPEVGVQLARQMIERDNIQILSGLLYSHVSEAVLGAVLPTGRLVVAVSGADGSRLRSSTSRETPAWMSGASRSRDRACATPRAPGSHAMWLSSSAGPSPRVP